MLVQMPSWDHKLRAKFILLGSLVVGITLANYFTHGRQGYYEYFFQTLYFVPLILSPFWFGLRGALLTSASISILYIPFVVWHWSVFTPEEFESLLEVLVYNVIAAVLGILRDREQRQLKRLRQSERLAAVGKAVSSVAHEMKTPLIAVGGFTRLVHQKLPQEDPDREKLSIVIRETQRLEKLIEEMLDFSSSLRLKPNDEDIEKLIRESFAIVELKAQEKRVRLESTLRNDLPPVTCDGTRIKQVLINLLANAIESSPEEASVTVEATRHDERIVIDVIDHGAGIPRELRDAVFEPFFTTKKHGTGLGLPIVKKIVEAHDGRLEILENDPDGLTMRVVLPASRVRQGPAPAG